MNNSYNETTSNETIPILIRPYMIGFEANKNSLSATSLSLINGTISGIYYLLQFPTNAFLNITANIIK